MEFLLKIRHKDLLPRREHFCCQGFCEPLNETALKRRGYIPMETPMVTDDNMYLCKYGDFHICSPDVCMYDEVCPISGASQGYIQAYSSYDKHDSRTFGKPGKNEVFKKTLHLEEEVLQKIENMIDCLLYSEYRSKINNMWKEKQNKLCKKDKDTYVQENCKDLPLNIIGLMMVDSRYENIKDKPPLKILQRETNRISNYIYIISQVYELVKQHTDETKICVESITLATLYKMQQGINIDGITMLPVDGFLVQHLPLMNDLPRFKVDKKKYTKGDRLIHQIINSFTKNKLPMCDLIIKEKRKNE